MGADDVAALVLQRVVDGHIRERPPEVRVRRSVGDEIRFIPERLDHPEGARAVQRLDVQVLIDGTEALHAVAWLQVARHQRVLEVDEPLLRGGADREG